MKDYILQVAIKNGPLLTAMRNAGFITAAEFSRASGVSQQEIGKYLALSQTPMTRHGEWRRGVIKMSKCLRLLPEDLFPIQHLKSALTSNKAEVSVNFDEWAMLSGNNSDPEVLLLEKQKIDATREALASLTEREAFVITEQFGLDDGTPKTARQIADLMGISAGRVQQIEAKAIRKLRHPSRNAKLREFVND